MLHSQGVLLFLVMRIRDLAQVSEGNYWCAQYMLALEFLSRYQIRDLDGGTAVL